MAAIKTKIRVALDGTLSGHAAGLPAGEHNAAIVLLADDGPQDHGEFEDLLARVRAIQGKIAALPILDRRSVDEIVGYNEKGHFD